MQDAYGAPNDSGGANSRPRVLFLAAHPPYPLDSGHKQRSFHLLKALSSRYDVTLLTFASGRKPEHYGRELMALCHDIVVVHHPRLDQNPVPPLLNSLKSDTPYTVLRYRSSELRKELRSLLQQRDFALVHFDRLEMAQYLDDVGEVPTVLSTHTVRARSWERHGQTHILPGRAVFAWQHQLVERFELDVIARVDSIIASSQQDRQWIFEHSSQRSVAVVPNGVDFQKVASATTPPTEANTIGFVGSLDWPPNSEGVTHFLREIWPEIKRRVPGVRFYLVGRRPTTEIRAQALIDKSVVVVGAVDDIRPYMQRCALYVAPLYVASGARLRILEACALGKGVVSTPIGAEGIDAIDGESILIARDDSHMVDLVVELLADESRTTYVGENARVLAKQSHDWSTIGQQYLAHLGSLQR